MNPEPLYCQIMNRILSMIESGELAYSAKLPTEREMAAKLNVARGTVKKAYGELEKSGVISIVWGSGAYVIKKADSGPNPLQELSAAYFTALSKAEMTPREAEEFINIRHRKTFHPGAVQIALIDICPECLAVFSRQLQDFRGYRASSILMEDLLRFKNSALIFDGYDMILSAKDSAEALRKLIPESKDKIWEFGAALSKEAQIDLIKIMNFEKAGLFSDSRAFRDRVNTHLKAKGRRLGEKDQLLAKWADREEFDAFTTQKRYLITPPLYSMNIKPEVYEGLYEFLRSGGDIITFNYEIERSSLLRIEEKVQKILYTVS